MKRIISIILALVSLSLMTAVAVSAQENQTAFSDISDVRQTVNKIYQDNYDEFESLAKTIRPSIGEDNEYFTYDTNCGPCTLAFQKILYDNGIVVENQRPKINYDHVYNMLRTSYASSPDVETCIVIDTTYKQFLTTSYKNNGYTYDDMASELPDILIYEYGDFDQLCEQLSALFERFSEEEAIRLCNTVFKWGYLFEYQISDFQYLGSNSLMNYSSEFIEDIRNNNGKHSIKHTDTLILNSTNLDAQKTFEYDTNGVYRCYLENAEIANYKDGFTIVNQSGEQLYGAAEASTALYPVTNTMYTTDGYIQLLDQSGAYPMTINASSLYAPAVMCIDLGSGLDTPSIYLIPVTSPTLYGDVNRDGTLNINDVTYLQKSIAGYSGYVLDSNQLSIADVTKTGALNISNATAISKKIAGLEDFTCGEKLYFSQYVYLGFNQNLGYIDF